MLHRLLIAVSFALSGFVATTSSALAAFDPSRDELMGITGIVIAAVIAFLTLVYAIKWYFELDRQDPNNEDLRDYLSNHH